MKKFLLIDDDESELVYVKFLLKDRYNDDFTLAYAKTLDEAQSYLASEDVDKILLDDNLGNGLTSAATIPLLQKNSGNVPIIIISKDIDGDHLKNQIHQKVNKVIDKFDLRAQLALGVFD